MGTAVFLILFRLISSDAAIDGIRNGDFQKMANFPHFFPSGSVSSKSIYKENGLSLPTIKSVPFSLFLFAFSIFFIPFSLLRQLIYVIRY